MPRPAQASSDHVPIEIEDFGYGLMNDGASARVPFGAAIESRNCDYYDRTIEARRGYSSVLENGPGAIKIADFESGESWTGGAVDSLAPDYVTHEAEADGTRGRMLQGSGGGATQTTELVKSPAVNLGSSPDDLIHVWVYTYTLDATITGYNLEMHFETSANNYYRVVVSVASDTWNALELKRGKYHRFRLEEFVKVGSPDWASIAKIRFQLSSITGTGALWVTMDNLHRTPGRMQDLFQFQRSQPPYAGARDNYAIANGVLYRMGDYRWIQVFSGFSAAAPAVYSLTAQDRRLMSDGVTSPRVMLADGATVYRLGIAPPPRQIAATHIVGGGLTDQKYYVMVQFYSTKTGTFSGPDERVPTTPTVTITGGANTAALRFTNIPVSADPQVDWVVIGLRPESEPQAFYRLSNNPFGEVANGTTTFDFTGQLSELIARGGDSILDPDMDYPSVIDPTTKLPVEGHPLYLEEIGGYVVTIMAEQPTVLRISRFRYPGSWQIDDEIPVGENDSEAVSAIAKHAGALMVAKPNKTYWGHVVGGDEKIVIDSVIGDRGFVDHRSVVKVSDSLLVGRGVDAVYAVKQDFIPRQVTDRMMRAYKALWAERGFGSGAGVFIRERGQVALFGRPKDSTFNTVAVVVHQQARPPAQPRRSPEWAPTLWDVPADVACEVLGQNGFEPWIAANGQVFRLNQGYEDDGRMVEWVHATPLIHADKNRTAIWPEMDIEGIPAGDYNITIEAYVGPATAPDVTRSTNLTGRSAPLGTFVLGASVLGAPQYIVDRIKISNQIAGRYIRFRLRCRTRARVAVTRLTPWWHPLGTQRPTT